MSDEIPAFARIKCRRRIETYLGMVCKGFLILFFYSLTFLHCPKKLQKSLVCDFFFTRNASYPKQKELYSVSRNLKQLFVFHGYFSFGYPKSKSRTAKSNFVGISRLIYILNFNWRDYHVVPIVIGIPRNDEKKRKHLLPLLSLLHPKGYKTSNNCKALYAPLFKAY